MPLGKRSSFSLDAATEDSAPASRRCWIVPYRSVYQNRPTLTVCFYGAVTDFERETAMRLVEANRVNMGFSSAQVYFAEKPELMAEVIKSR